MNKINLIKIIRSVPISKTDLYVMNKLYANEATINLKKSKEIAEAIIKRESEWR